MGNEEKLLIAYKEQCVVCGEEVWTKHQRHYVTCSCGQLSLDGGRTWTCSIGEGINTSVYSDSPFEIIRMYEIRSGRGKDGRQPFRFVPISEMSDDWLHNAIEYTEGSDTPHHVYLLMEQQYRLDNNIVVKE
jgi:hypothetical protein